MPPAAAAAATAIPAPAKKTAVAAKPKVDPNAIEKITAAANARAAAKAAEAKATEGKTPELVEIPSEPADAPAEEMPPLDSEETPAKTEPKHVNLGAINRAYNILSELADQPFDGDAAYSILKIRQWAYPHFVHYVKAREELLAKHATKVADGKWSLPIERGEAFAADMHRLDSEQVDLDDESAGALSPRMFRTAKITPNSLEQLSIFY